MLMLYPQAPFFSTLLVEVEPFVCGDRKSEPAIEWVARQRWA